jgi:hypothetical protein
MPNEYCYVSSTLLEINSAVFEKIDNIKIHKSREHIENILSLKTYYDLSTHDNNEIIDSVSRHFNTIILYSNKKDVIILSKDDIINGLSDYFYRKRGVYHASKFGLF